MMNFKTWLENDLDDFFKLGKNHKIVKQDVPKVQNYTLELYRGFNGNFEEIKKEGDFYILNPKRSEQGMLWFTHRYISHYNPIQYAATHGDYFLTYPLKCKKHIQILHWDDGTTSETIPDDISKKSIRTENCQFYQGIELPEGWVFTYKTEKFIGCSNELRITKDMIQESKNVLED